MRNDRVLEQIHGILARAGEDFSVSPAGDSFLVPVPDGSAAVYIDVTEWDGHPLVTLRSYVLVQVEADEDAVLRELNRLNAAAYYARVWYRPGGTIIAEHEILGTELDAVELITALHALGGYADQIDDELLVSLGSGKRAADLWAEAAAAAGGEDESG